MTRLPFLLMVAVLAAGACGGDDEPAAADRPAAVFALRPVVDESQPPCPKETSSPDVDVLAERQDGKVASCLSVGPAIVDAADVRSASLGDLEGGGKSVSIVLGRNGAANLDAFAARSMGKRIAIVVDEKLVRAPTVQSARFYGRIEVVGLPDGQATTLFEELRRRQNPS